MAISKQNELENLILTICPHEEANRQVKTRTPMIEDWAQSLGICEVLHQELNYGDYALEGEFREHEIDLNIEYKTWDNFISASIDDMEDKLTRSFEEYTDIALFVETWTEDRLHPEFAKGYTFKPDPQGQCYLNYTEGTAHNFKMKGIKPPTKTLAAMEGFFDTLQFKGVHVRQLRGESQFKHSLYNLLVYLTNPHNLKVKETSYEQSIINHYMTLPEIGFVRAKKLFQSYPNPSWLNSASEDSLIRLMGRTTGLVIYQYLHNHSFETDAWKCNYHMDGTSGNNAEPEPIRICPICKTETVKSACPQCEPANNRTKQETHIKQEFKACQFADPVTKAECKTPDHFKIEASKINIKDDPAMEQREKEIEKHLCTTCTKKPKTCNTSKDDKLDNGIDVILCMGYENKYPNKPMNPDETKHQTFKRQKAGFKSKPAQSLSRVQNTSKLENGKPEINSTHDNLQSSPDPLTIQAGIDQGTSSPPKSKEFFHCPEQGEAPIPSPAPNFKNVDGYLTHYCYEPVTMKQIMNRLYPQFSKDYLFSAVCRMTNEGGLRRFSEQGVMKWIIAVTADKELDIGV